MPGETTNMVSSAAQIQFILCLKCFAAVLMLACCSTYRQSAADCLTLYVVPGLISSLSMPTFTSAANHLNIIKIIIMWFEWRWRLGGELNQIHERIVKLANRLRRGLVGVYLAAYTSVY